MVDSKTVRSDAADDKQEEPVLTRLVSSGGLASSKIEAWQLSQFEQFDVSKPEVEPEISAELYRQVQQKIEPELKQQAELLKKEAYDLAYQKGYQEGFDEGSEKGRVEAKELALQSHNEALSAKLTELDALLSMFKQPYDQLETQVLSELSGLALHIAYEVTQKEVSAHKEWVLEAVQEAVQVLPDDSKEFFIELSSVDFELLQSLDHPMVSQWDLKVNNTLDQGTCVIKQGNSSILNSWKARFDEVASQLLTHTSSATPTSPS